MHVMNNLEAQRRLDNHCDRHRRRGRADPARLGYEAPPHVNREGHAGDRFQSRRAILPRRDRESHAVRGQGQG